MNSHQQRLSFLRAKGFSPKVIYDIGAHKGTWSDGIKQVFPLASFYLFEANEHHIPYLQKQPFPYFIHLLGDQEKDVTFYSINGTGDSIFRENTSYYQGTAMSMKTLRMTTLSFLVEKNQIPCPDLIKIDVQGAEKLILSGSRSLVCFAEAIIIETKVLEYNIKAPLMDELISFMNDLGYRILDILELHYLPTGELSEIDFLFVKRSSYLIKEGLLI